MLYRLSSICALQISQNSLCALQVSPEFYLCSTDQHEFSLCSTGQPDPELPAPSAGGPGGSDEDHLHRAPLLPLLRGLTVPVGIHLLEVREEVMRVRGQGSGVRGQAVPGGVPLLEVLERVRGLEVRGQGSGVRMSLVAYTSWKYCRGSEGHRSRVTCQRSGVRGRLRGSAC